MRRRIAVTGASGFVGRQVLLAASASGWDGVGVARSYDAGRAIVKAGGHPVVVPALETEGLARAFSGAEAVVHLAQIGAERGGDTYEAVNQGLTRRVIEAARAASVPRVVFFSGLGVARYGKARRTTNPYFLSKLACEVELFRSGLEVAVFRPSYIVGPGDGLVPDLLRQMAAGEVEQVGDGSHGMQPVFVRDAAAAVLSAVERAGPHPAVLDLVGPEPVSFSALVERVARAAEVRGRKAAYRVREVSEAEADRRAASSGYHGMRPDELDCLLCGEVAAPGPLEALLGRFLTPLDEALDAAVRAFVPERPPALS